MKLQPFTTDQRMLQKQSKNRVTEICFGGFVAGWLTRRLDCKSRIQLPVEARYKTFSVLPIQRRLVSACVAFVRSVHEIVAHVKEIGF